MPEQVTMSYVSRCVSEEYYKKGCNIAQEQCNDWKKFKRGQPNLKMDME